MEEGSWVTRAHRGLQSCCRPSWGALHAFWPHLCIHLRDGPWAALPDASGSRPLWKPSTLGEGAAAGVAKAQKGVLSL